MHTIRFMTPLSNITSPTNEHGCGNKNCPTSQEEEDPTEQAKDAQGSKVVWTLPDPLPVSLHLLQ